MKQWGWIFLKIIPIWVSVNILCSILPILIRVAFVTLLERKILGLSQYRKGPNKVSFFGLMQPIRDAIKLFLKENIFLAQRNVYWFCASPVISIILMLWITTNIPNNMEPGSLIPSILILVILSLGIYPIFIRGWRSNSKYALLGRIRGVAQTISYEIALALLFFSFFLFTSNFEINIYLNFSSRNSLITLPISVVLFVCCVAETNRTPFDFAEGERELVSGFNTEYGGGLFALIFIAEYGIIVFFSFFLSILVPIQFFLSSLSLLFFLFFLILWIWFRSTYPRYRYDKLLNLAWKSFLPWALTLAFFYFALKFL